MTRCCTCMTWFHDRCIENDGSPEAIWVCDTCRLVPSTLVDVQNKLKGFMDAFTAQTTCLLSIKDDIDDQKISLDECITNQMLDSGCQQNKFEELTKKIDMMEKHF